MQHRLHIRPARKHPPTLSRDRVLYAVLTLAVVAAGLLRRSGLIALPPVVSERRDDAPVGADGLYRFRIPTPPCAHFDRRTSGVDLFVECRFSQLYHATWIDAVRTTIPGNLVLGNTFNWPDLPAYVVGIVFSALPEWQW